jgi:RNA polymerase sigma-70 factor (ECF subfamily)
MSSESLSERERDEEVLRAVQRRDPMAFDRFVERFGNRIYAFGLRVCGHREDAEDVLQETLLTIYRKLRELREPAALVTWLYRIVANTCVSTRRKARVGAAEELSLEGLLPDGEAIGEGPWLPDEAGPEMELYRQEVSRALDAALQEIPADYRVVWVMRDVEGLSTAETAEALGLSVPNVKMRLHRARLSLRKQLAHLRYEGAAP